MWNWILSCSLFFFMCVCVLLYVYVCCCSNLYKLCKSTNKSLMALTVYDGKKKK